MIETSYPLSPMQQGMLFQQLSDAGAGVNIEQVVCSLREDLDVPALDRAWQRLTERHAVLRTSFGWDASGQPVQMVHREVSVGLEQRDWSSLSSEEQQSRLTAYLDADRRKGFVLAEAPLQRLALIRFGKSNYELIWTLHHIVVDEQTVIVMLKEAFNLYEAYSRGRDLPLEPPRPYQDYIEWLRGQPASQAERFWREKLAGFTTPTPLGAAGLKSEKPEPRGEEEIRFSADVTARLKSFCRKSGLGLNICVQGAWSVLLSRYSGEEDVVFGAARACRKSGLRGLENVAGLFMNVLPVRARIKGDAPVTSFLRDLRAWQRALRDYEHTPLASVQSWSEVPPGTPLFESLLLFYHESIDSQLHHDGDGWQNRRVRAIDRTGFPITLYACAEPEFVLTLCFDSGRFDRATISRMSRHLQVLLEGIASNPDQRLADLPMLTEAERHQLLIDWNPTPVDSSRSACLHELFEERVARTPDSIALVFEGEELTYRELNGRANRLARYLRAREVGPEALVGVLLERSVDLVVGLLAILKAGGAYVPLDPTYPEERLTFMLNDAEARLVLTHEHLANRIREYGGTVVCADRDWDRIVREPAENLDSGAKPDNLAYVIYTSGSTGQPKGVMVEHRNVVSMFSAMDDCMGEEPPGVWLAVTSISFDISMLELFFTLTRGFRVVLQGREGVVPTRNAPRQRSPSRRIDFSLFYFASDAGESQGERYRLLLEGARFADAHDFAAVWTPERHFHAFGGIFPNPSVTGAAVAAVTRSVAVRAGSVVMPLHDPIRVAEEWAVVDNLSGGRVGIAFASGWHTNDFALAPDKYSDRKRVTFEGLETVRRLWRGETVAARSGDGKEIEVRALPPPVQRELPFWITTAGNAETFRQAGELGANLLTNLLGQDVPDLPRKIEVYREARRAAGHSGEGIVTVMIHTFLGEDIAAVREKVRIPFSRYLASSFDLMKMVPWAFPNFRQPSKAGSGSPAFDAEGFTPEDLEALIAHAFERYFETAGLFGTPDSCLPMVEGLRGIGVDEVACLIDFGVDTDSVLESLHHLDKLRRQSALVSRAGETEDSIAAAIRLHGVTHLQCTPSLAQMLVSDPDSRSALASLRRLLVGGEALPEPLAAELSRAVPGEIQNMYGPTETTIWSTASLVGNGGVTIGRPIANTEVYILDRVLEPVPVGVAGEIYIGGDGVARGYWRRPDLTASRFVPNPFSEKPGARLYRTGDRGRYQPDGQIEFLGRADDQVKIRGHRVEPREIEAVLARHPEVRESAVVARDESAGLGLVAYVVPRRMEGSDGAGAIAAWRDVWDETYRGANPASSAASASVTAEDAPFETVGWRRRETGESIPAEEMREWVDGVVGRVLALRPRRVLEIGCGTGLLLFSVAPKCERYQATDFSAVALEWLERQVRRRGSALAHVSLSNRPADDFSDAPSAGPFDAVVLNSVIQYFPDAGYLLRVLEGAVRSVGETGFVFIGDVRNLLLRQAFEASIELAKAPESLSRESWRERVERAVAREEELLVDPAFFRALPRTFPKISQVHIWAKRGRRHNEMTRFRYDVLLRIGERVAAVGQTCELDWSQDGMTVEKLDQRLRQSDRPERLCVRGVPDARLRYAMALTRWLESRDGPASVGAMRQAVQQTGSDGVDPEELWRLGGETGYDVEVVPAADAPGFFEAVFQRDARVARATLVPEAAPRTSPSPEAWEGYANRPARSAPSARGVDFERRLRGFLERQLPPHMVPSRMVQMAELPRTPNGKLNRKALPVPEEAASEIGAAYVAPRGVIGEVIAGVWAEVLGVDRVGVTANFFELGGHSLSAVRVIFRLREIFQVELPLSTLFESPTVEEFTRVLVARESRPGETEKIARLVQRLESISPEEVGERLRERMDERPAISSATRP